MMGNKPEKADGRGGTFFLLPHCLTKSAAWRTASPRAIKALFVLWGRHTGFNNGRIGMSLDDLAEGMDSQNHRGNARALAELIGRGMVALTRDHPKSSRLAREYRLTFLPTAGGPATHDYLSWTVGDLGTRKKPVVETAGETSVSAVETATDWKLSAVETATERKPNNANPPFFQSASVAETTGHIVSHLGGSLAALSNLGRKADGPLPGAQILTAAPSNEELRERALAHIDRFGRGSQGRLAERAGIPPGTFSKFVGGGKLSDRHRIGLACAFPKTETAERRGMVAA